jgi:hypothetical protein
MLNVSVSVKVNVNVSGNVSGNVRLAFSGWCTASQGERHSADRSRRGAFGIALRDSMHGCAGRCPVYGTQTAGWQNDGWIGRHTGARRSKACWLVLQEVAQLVALSQAEAAANPASAAPGRGAAGDAGGAEGRRARRARRKVDYREAAMEGKAQEVDFQRMSAALRDGPYPELENCIPPAALTAELLRQTGFRQPMWIPPVGRGSTQIQTLEVGVPAAVPKGSLPRCVPN